MLSAPCVKANLTVSTITGSQTSQSCLVSGLTVKDVYGSFSDWIPLPPTYSHDSIDVKCDEMATPETLNRWPYLIGIENQLGKGDKSISKVDLIIGANNPKALEPSQKSS